MGAVYHTRWWAPFLTALCRCRWHTNNARCHQLNNDNWYLCIWKLSDDIYHGYLAYWGVLPYNNICMYIHALWFKECILEVPLHFVLLQPSSSHIRHCSRDLAHYTRDLPPHSQDPQYPRDPTISTWPPITFTWPTISTWPHHIHVTSHLSHVTSHHIYLTFPIFTWSRTIFTWYSP